jgi:hypothetical protein
MTNRYVMHGCAGKRAYLSFTEAQGAFDHMRKNHDDTEAVNVYRCRACHHFHIGSSFKRPSRRPPARRARAWHWRTAIEEA